MKNDPLYGLVYMLKPLTTAIRAICGLFLHQWNTENRKHVTLQKKKTIFLTRHLNPYGINELFSFEWFIHVLAVPYFHEWCCSTTPYIKPHTTHNSSFRSDEGLTIEVYSLSPEVLMHPFSHGGIFPVSLNHFFFWYEYQLMSMLQTCQAFLYTKRSD